MINLTIKIPSRLHLTLIAMHDDNYRQNGGVGFAINTPGLEVTFSINNSLELTDTRDDGFTSDELQRTKDLLLNIAKEKRFISTYKAIIQGSVPTHMGFGSGTAMRLALIEGLYLINDEPYTHDDIIAISQRGGVSGIGVRTYFEGGLVFDIGRSTHSDFLPSSAMEGIKKTPPLVCKHTPMPQWQIGICVPNISPKSENEEKSFFQETCPIEPEQSYEMLYHVVYGVVASVMENDVTTFAESIKAIQSRRWKEAERGLYGQKLLDIEKQLYDSGAKAVGMSSLGASLYFIGDDINNIIERAKTKLPKCQLWGTQPNNSGREIIYD